MYERLFARQGLSLNRLRSFLLVVDAGSITLAAPGDAIRQSQYSRQISELEDFFGHELFARRGRTRALTPAGERLARVVRHAFSGLGDVHAEAGGQRVTFALGAGDSLLHGLVIPRLGPALAKLSGAQISLVSLAGRDIVPRLDDGRLDFGILPASLVPRGVESAALGTVEYALYLPRRLLRKGLSPDELLASAPLALQQSEPQLNQKLLDHARERGIVLDLALACETFPQAVRAVASGCYASLLPTLARTELPAEVVEVQPEGLAKTTTKIALVWQKRCVRVRPLGESVAAALAAALRISRRRDGLPGNKSSES